MVLNEEMKKMLDVIKLNDEKLRKNNDLYKYYYAPDIPDKVLKKLVKYFDSNLPINGIVAYYDSTILNSSKAGIIFTNDGIYYRYIGKAVYFQYNDIESMYMDKDNLVLVTNIESMPNFTIIDVFELEVLKEILKELKAIDEEYGQSLVKSSGKVKKLDLPPDKLKKCNEVIHTASVACGGVGTGLAQIPASDNAIIVPIQITMIVSLGAVFELSITESGAKSIIASASATVVGRTVSQFLVGWIPGIGNAINTATAAGLTEAIGWIAVRNFYERWVQDMNKGRFEGMKIGYNEASMEYEKKLRKQAEEFLNQMKDVEQLCSEYEQLLLEYENYIKELETKNAATNLINEMKGIYEELKGLKNA